MSLILMSPTAAQRGGRKVQKYAIIRELAALTASPHRESVWALS